MALKNYMSEAAQRQVDELTQQSKKIQVEIADIVARETEGKELDALAQQELRALQIIGEAFRSGSLDQYFESDPQGGRFMAATMSSTVINQLADRMPQAEASSPVNDEWPETLPRSDES